MKDYYQELHNIAAQAMPTPVTTPSSIDSIVDKLDTNKLNDSLALAKSMYPEDQASQFSFWKSQVKAESLSTAGKNLYWKQYEEMHPEGMVGAKRDFIDITKQELGVISGLAPKEFFLRERLSTTPAWARKELDPLLGELSANVANSNYAKSQKVYLTDLNNRINNFMVLNELDPDVPIETHVDDFLRLEQINLMDLAKTQQGRVGVHSEEGQFHPAFGIKDRTQIFRKEMASMPSSSEQLLIRELAPNTLRKAIAGKVYSSRTKIQTQERTVNSVATSYLMDGTYSPETWDSAFALLPEVPIKEKLSYAIQGEIASKRIKTEKELAQLIFKTMTKYESLLGDPANAK